MLHFRSFVFSKVFSRSIIIHATFLECYWFLLTSNQAFHGHYLVCRLMLCSLVSNSHVTKGFFVKSDLI